MVVNCLIELRKCSIVKVLGKHMVQLQMADYLSH